MPDIDIAREVSARAARELVGEDEAAFVVLFTALFNIAGEIAEAPDDALAEAAAGALVHVSRGRRTVAAGGRMRSIERPRPSVTATMQADPVLRANTLRLIGDRQRIVGGRPTDGWPDCVAVGGPGQWCCTGTLVAPDLVLTAGHCFPSCVDRVFVGTDVSRSGHVVGVAEANRRPDYDEQLLHNDLTVLVLEEPIQDVPPRDIAPAEVVDAAETVHLVGFGTTNPEATEGFGLKREVDVPIAAPRREWGVDETIEFAAGAPLLDKDSCRGDSGGPAYVQTADGFKLAGATSRAAQITDELRLCGDGGIYTRAHAFEEWILSGGR
jgi:secreted trypsin-like serine protease